jgi:hypothetical protein
MTAFVPAIVERHHRPTSGRDAIPVEVTAR